MGVTLAMTWWPRGEMGRFERLLPKLRELYSAIVISMPPQAEMIQVNTISAFEGVLAFRNEERSHGRFNALKNALNTDCDFVHYCDGDRLIRWIETRPEELSQSVQDLQAFDCTVIGRSERAFNSHPATLRETEIIINMVFSHIIGQQLDFGSGSKAFSRRAVEMLMTHARQDSGLGSDTEWPVLCHKAGLSVGALWVDGLDWETADRYQDAASDEIAQHTLADKVDADPKRWLFRVQMAQDIIRAGLDASKLDIL